MLIPIRTSSLYNQSPLPNWLIMGANIAVFFAAVGLGFRHWLMEMALQNGDPSVRAFGCPHCQAALEVDTTSLPSSGSLLCPGCKGTINLVVE